MILIKILDHNLHRSKNSQAAPLMQEIPAQQQFLPAVISTTRGKFVVSRKLFEGTLLRVGVFDHDPDYLDNVINDMFSTALSLSKEEKWENVFSGKGSTERAFNYISDATGGMAGQPHICLIPDKWSPTKVFSFFWKVSY